METADAIIALGAGQYRLCGQLGGSAYGVVWRALGPRGEVALKLVNRDQMARAHPLQQERWITSARNEIAFLRSLAPWDERHVVRLLDSGEHDGLPVMALELLDTDLGRHIAIERDAGRPLAAGQLLDWLAQINQALAKVHQYGWSYLDLKPANVLLSRRHGNVKLADFGTSRLLADGRASAYAGTASWQAPEQFFPDAAGGYHTDTRTDYFALGALFYYLVTGGLPLRFCSDCGQAYREHRTEGAAMLLARHGNRPPPTLHDDEAAHFARAFGRRADACTWNPATETSTGGAHEALLLLRALLGAERARRPRHAMQISRMIGAIRAALPASIQP
ncbi:serine/threonine-protein kinase [Massilia sp. DJPM01]|uniref:serine/threonine-protein kinase n=1 Tax=Massilia sp. DJPM01 TaxID=3024404 RepID=UPI00259DA2A7|nr:serine/threonine-protein kinase [Massilia sp. DJPM01]MDM5176933.1 serine/threonine-protein kinase [Massilia sp. DJPM01]